MEIKKKRGGGSALILFIHYNVALDFVRFYMCMTLKTSLKYLNHSIRITTMYNYLSQVFHFTRICPSNGALFIKKYWYNVFVFSKKWLVTSLTPKRKVVKYICELHNRKNI